MHARTHARTHTQKIKCEEVTVQGPAEFLEEFKYETKLQETSALKFR